MKKLICTLIFLIVCCVSAAALADISGVTGNGLPWVIDSTGTLTVSGSGPMGEPTWKDHVSLIRKAVLQPGVTTVYMEAFRDCSNMTEISLPDSLDAIGQWAFMSCESLTSIRIPNGVTQLGDSTFYGCTSLRTVIFPPSFKTIGLSVFEGCSTLNIYVDSLQQWLNLEYRSPFLNGEVWGFPFSYYNLYVNNQLLTELTSANLPSGLTYIPQFVFACCQSLQRVDLPEGIRGINIMSFGGCHNLTTVNLPKSLEYIYPWSFSRSGITAIKLPPKMQSIHYYAFYACEQLASVELPYGMQTIGEACFYGCNNLTSITIPPTVNKINKYNFYNFQTIYCAPGSYAEQWCQENGIPYITVAITPTPAPTSVPTLAPTPVPTPTPTAIPTATPIATPELPTTMELNKSSATLNLASSQTVELFALFNTYWPESSVTWTSSNTAVASVKSIDSITTLVTAKKAGTAVITGTSSNGLTATCQITVKAPTVKFSSLKSTSKKQATIKFKADASMKAWQLSYRIKGKSSWKTVTIKSTGKTASKIVKNLTSKKTYEFRVRAQFRAPLGNTVTTAWSSVKTLKIK